MKLGKSLIITGLLFSSILGSVNVGSITAMAADGDKVTAPTPNPAPTPAQETREISIRYVDKDDNQITDGEFLESVNSPIRIAQDADKFSVSKLNLPENYKVADDATEITVGPKNVDELKVTVVNVPKETVNIQYPAGVSNEDSRLPKVLVLKDKTKQVKSDNLKDIPAGYEFSGYANNVVTLKRIVKTLINVIFIDENNVEVGTYTLKGKNVQETVSEQEVNVPKEFTAVAGQNAVIATKIDDKGIVSYSTKIRVKKIGTTVSHNVGKKPARHSHGGFSAQRVRISFIDQAGNEVGYQQLNGNVSFDKKISAPEGYSFVNANEANIKFDKSGNKELKLKVTKNKPVSTMEEGIVTTNSGDFKHLYTIEGKDITNRGLSGDSKWYTDQYATINGEKMFRVATNEWVKATDVYK